ncbi:MAG: ATP-binding protein [Oscillospiraceae bacterium]|nr:ATP-binding protein [Oscillospiraceae bacterium]
MQLNSTIIGRAAQQEKLWEYFDSGRSEFVALYGRRRVGKTYLVRETLGAEITFYATGMLDSGESEQIKNFNNDIADYGGSNLVPAENWSDAFQNLKALIGASKKDKKKVIFLDEIPWMSTPRSGFLSALDYFWNHYCTTRKDILLIICGSAASWIIENVVNNTGGLHNRLTGEINLQPFTLRECEEYFRARGIDIPRYQVAEAYMIFGGIPYYLDYFRPKYSLAQNVDEIYFKDDAPLRNEYANIYRSLFKNADGHMKVIEALAARNYGKRREELVAATGITEGGWLTKIINELVISGFVREYRAYGKKSRDRLYQLVDPFTLFCIRFGAKRDTYSSDFWMRFCTTPAHAAWAGYAYEILCLLHVQQIRKALGISGVMTEIYSWRSKVSDPGAQIDLVIERADQVINLCEIKFASAEFEIDKATDLNLRNKRAAFVSETATKKSAHTTLITTYGLRRNAYQAGIPFEVKLDDMFE